MTLPVFTRGEWEDFGHGVRVRRVFEDGELCAVDYQHPSPNLYCGNGDRGDYIPCGTDERTVRHFWRLENAEPLTLSPSLQCPHCNHHGFIRGGVWVPA